MTFLELVTPECIAEDFEGEVVILNQSTGLYFSVQESALDIWNALNGGHSTEAVIEACSEAGIDQEVQRFIDELIGFGLLRPSIEAPRSDVRPVFQTRTDALKPPVLQRYDDMQSLLLLCAVHDPEVSEDPDSA